MNRKKVTWDDLRHEILGLKGAILGAKAGLFHGGEVTKEILETFQELAIQIHNIAEVLEVANTKGICIWTHDEHHEKWDTSCGEAFCFIDGSPKENKMKYCCYCGRKLKEKKSKT